MRTKALLGAAILAAGLASSMAQNVYSLNVVGYYNVTIPANSFGMIANQFNTTNNTLASLIPNPPVNTTVYKYNNGWTAYVFDELDLAWSPNGNATINPGEGIMVKNVQATPMTITFVGDVPQGNLTNSLPAGYAVRSSMVPQAGSVSTLLGFPGQPNDTIYKYSGGYTAYVFVELDLAWSPSEPAMGVGEAFFSKKIAAENWVRNFTVPQN
jgi:hypothetical protein